MKYQVVVLAGGESSRFAPFNTKHKSFFEICGKNIIEHVLTDVLKLNATGVIVVLGENNFDEEKGILSQDPRFGHIKFVSQKNALGMADAILCAQDLIKDDFFVINAQQLNLDKIAEKFIEKFEYQKPLAVVGSAVTDEPQKYGVLKYDGTKVTGIIEKPEKGYEPSNKRVVGIYLLSKDLLKNLKTEALTEYSFETVLNTVAKEGRLSDVEIQDAACTLKYPWDILGLKDLILAKIPTYIDKSAIIEKTALIKGDGVFIGKGAHLYDYSIVEGPAYIGEDAVVGVFSQVRKGSVLEKSSQIERYVDVRNSVIGQNTHIHSGFIGDSVIGKDVRIGAGFVSANKRLDRGQVKTLVNGNLVETNRVNLGAIIGDGTKLGINVSTMPGVIIGNNKIINPGSQISKNEN